MPYFLGVSLLTKITVMSHAMTKVIQIEMMFGTIVFWLVNPVSLISYTKRDLREVRLLLSVSEDLT